MILTLVLTLFTDYICCHFASLEAILKSTTPLGRRRVKDSETKVKYSQHWNKIATLRASEQTLKHQLVPLSPLLMEKRHIRLKNVENSLLTLYIYCYLYDFINV